MFGLLKQAAVVLFCIAQNDQYTIPIKSPRLVALTAENDQPVITIALPGHVPFSTSEMGVKPMSTVPMSTVITPRPNVLSNIYFVAMENTDDSEWRSSFVGALCCEQISVRSSVCSLQSVLYHFWKKKFVASQEKH